MQNLRSVFCLIPVNMLYFFRIINQCVIVKLSDEQKFDRQVDGQYHGSDTRLSQFQFLLLLC
jgi:hypothetical protein